MKRRKLRVPQSIKGVVLHKGKRERVTRIYERPWKMVVSCSKCGKDQFQVSCRRGTHHINSIIDDIMAGVFGTGCAIVSEIDDNCEPTRQQILCYDCAKKRKMKTCAEEPRGLTICEQQYDGNTNISGNYGGGIAMDEQGNYVD